MAKAIGASAKPFITWDIRRLKVMAASMEV